MKLTHIIALLVIAVATLVIVATAGDASTYVSFEEAQAMANNGRTNKIHVVGELKKDNDGEIVGIQPSPNKLSFSFVMVDDNQQEQKVYYGEPMPPDFLRSEQVVVIGGYNNDRFVADKILLKCPSKYEEQEI
jgi:cytochrome c-type biogenesis protein CcmE